MAKTHTAQIKEDIAFIRRELEGYAGRPGLVKRVERLTVWQNYMIGGMTLLSALLGWGLIR